MARTLAVVVAFAALTAAPAVAQEQSPTFKKEIAIFSAAAAADWITTAHFMSYGRPERNPLFRPVRYNTAAVITIGAAADVGTVWLTRKIGRRHRRVAQVMLYSASAFRGFLAIRNEVGLDRLQREWSQQRERAQVRPNSIH